MHFGISSPFGPKQLIRSHFSSRIVELLMDIGKWMGMGHIPSNLWTPMESQYIVRYGWIVFWIMNCLKKKYLEFVLLYMLFTTSFSNCFSVPLQDWSGHQKFHSTRGRRNGDEGSGLRYSRPLQCHCGRELPFIYNVIIWLWIML